MSNLAYDTDLSILNECSNEQLKTLVDIIVFDKDGKKRYTESLSNTQSFAENYPNNLRYLIPAVVGEIQRFGGNTVLNILRGHGVSYRVILEDVCNKLKVNYNKKLSTPDLESELIRKVAVTAVEKMTEEDIKKFDGNLDKTRLMEAVMANNGPVVMAIIAIMIAQVTKNAAAKGGLAVFGKLLAPRVVAFAVPVLNVIAALWTLADIAGPAYRVTIPFTLTVAFIRRQLTDSSDNFQNLFV